MVLDLSLKTAGAKTLNETPTPVTNSYIDIGFGDNLKGFAGFHRFEVTRTTDEGDTGGGGATICYSAIACNPSVNKSPGPAFTYVFHSFYALTLFREGIAGVLQA
jgi:hypothetical protein